MGGCGEPSPAPTKRPRQVSPSATQETQSRSLLRPRGHLPPGPRAGLHIGEIAHALAIVPDGLRSRKHRHGWLGVRRIALLIALVGIALIGITGSWVRRCIRWVGRRIGWPGGIVERPPPQRDGWHPNPDMHPCGGGHTHQEQHRGYKSYDP